MKPLRSLGKKKINELHAKIQKLILATENKLEWDKLTDMLREQYKNDVLKRENSIFLVGYFCGRETHAKQLKNTMNDLIARPKTPFKKILGGDKN